MSANKFVREGKNTKDRQYIRSPGKELLRVHVHVYSTDTRQSKTYIGLRNGRSKPPNLSCPASFFPPKPPPSQNTKAIPLTFTLKQTFQFNFHCVTVISKKKEEGPNVDYNSPCRQSDNYQEAIMALKT